MRKDCGCRRQEAAGDSGCVRTVVLSGSDGLCAVGPNAIAGHTQQALAWAVWWPNSGLQLNVRLWRKTVRALSSHWEPVGAPKPWQVIYGILSALLDDKLGTENPWVSFSFSWRVTQFLVSRWSQSGIQDYVLAGTCFETSYFTERTGYSQNCE